MGPRPGDLAKAIESVCLRPNATLAEIDGACVEAVERHIAAICVLPAHVDRAAARLRGTDVKLIAMISFPFGADTTAVKVVAAEAAIADGADEVEVMIALSVFLSGDVNWVRDDLAAVVKAVRLRAMATGRRQALVRAVVETAYLDDRRIRLAARIVRAAGVDMAVTSTGLGPKSTSVLDVELLREELGGEITIKASGGVRTADEAADLVSAGAHRVGATAIAPLFETVVRGRR